MYDNRGRLKTATRDGSPSASYDYDANGNRLSVTTSSGSTTGTYDDQDRLLTYGQFTYTYSANGELKSKTDSGGGGTTTYVYDAFGNPKRVALPGGDIIEYLVDGENRRVAKRKNGADVKRWLYRDSLHPAAELEGSGTLLKRFVYASGKNSPDFMIQGGVSYRILSDQLGSPRLVVNTNTGEVVQRMRHDEFGVVLEDTSVGTTPFGFAGGLYDTDTGLVRFGARNYDPVVGRWMSKDPIRFGGGSANLYVYEQRSGQLLSSLGPLEAPCGPKPATAGMDCRSEPLDPNGVRFRHPSGDTLDFHRGRQGERGWKGRDHYHRNGEDDHLKPGSEVPDPPAVCRDTSPTYSTPGDQSNYYDDMIDDFFGGGLPLPLPWFSPWLAPELGPALLPAM